MRTPAHLVVPTVAASVLAVALTAAPVLAAPASSTSPTAYDVAAGSPASSTVPADSGRHKPRKLRTCRDVSKLAPVTPATKDAVAKLDVLDYLAGDWVGTGWSSGENGRSDYTQREVIRRKLSGELLTIEGTATAPSDPSRILFSAYATTTWDAQSGTYQWRAMSGGHETTTTLEVTSDGWAWEVAAGPTGKMRYVTTFSDNWRTWHETGAYTPDGVTWIPMMEMTLTKTCDAGSVS